MLLVFSQRITIWKKSTVMNIWNRIKLHAVHNFLYDVYVTYVLFPSLAPTTKDSLTTPSFPKVLFSDKINWRQKLLLSFSKRSVWLHYTLAKMRLQMKPSINLFSQILPESLCMFCNSGSSGNQKYKSHLDVLLAISAILLTVSFLLYSQGKSGTEDPTERPGADLLYFCIVCGMTVHCSSLPVSTRITS